MISANLFMHKIKQICSPQNLTPNNHENEQTPNEHRRLEYISVHHCNQRTIDNGVGLTQKSWRVTKNGNQANNCIIVHYETDGDVVDGYRKRVQYRTDIKRV